MSRNCDFTNVKVTTITVYEMNQTESKASCSCGLSPLVDKMFLNNSASAFVLFNEETKSVGLSIIVYFSLIVLVVNKSEVQTVESLTHQGLQILKEEKKNDHFDHSTA